MTDTEWTGMRNHHTVAVRVSDDHYRYLQEQKAAGTPIVEVIRQALTRHIESEAAAEAMPDTLTIYNEDGTVPKRLQATDSDFWDASDLTLLSALADDDPR